MHYEFLFCTTISDFMNRLRPTTPWQNRSPRLETPSLLPWIETQRSVVNSKKWVDGTLLRRSHLSSFSRYHPKYLEWRSSQRRRRKIKWRTSREVCKGTCLSPRRKTHLQERIIDEPVNENSNESQGCESHRNPYHRRVGFVTERKQAVMSAQSLCTKRTYHKAPIKAAPKMHEATVAPIRFPDRATMAPPQKAPPT